MSTLAVVSAGLREPSSTRLLADRLAAATVRSLGEETEVVHVALRDHAHDLTNNLLTGFPAGELRGAVERVVGADGLIAVTPVFNASYSGLFKTFFDVLEPGSLEGKPVLIGATGGTARHSLALEFAVRPMFAYLRSLMAPTAVFAATEDWGAAGEAAGGLVERVERAGAELAGLIDGRGGASDAVSDAGADRYDNVIPFEQLLAGN
ncbi:FMN reductase [Actinomadura rudentiformis]|uniref:NADPH-dependent FMN reductase n=1 Tax=Actinomadura rudentiformis TaxID=359158 RepID=A0A6H9YDM0_9ACTN|nr:FMN reductase [Actinomadura rudentiformis]KAB2343406.1 NADPH-dependent FMN reductase [Actinomadura rudentiformis]